MRRKGPTMGRNHRKRPRLVQRHAGAEVDGSPDALELLRQANPVPPGGPASPARSARAEALLEEILATPRRPRGGGGAQGRGRRRWVVPTAVGATLVLAGTAYALSNQATQSLSVGCYEKASLQADTAVMGADGRNPVDTCAEIWPNAYGGPAPDLVACVLESGTVGVFPGSGEETCAGLGLVMLSGEYPSGANAETIALRDRLVERLADEACLGFEAARTIALEELAALGLVEWQIEEGGGFAGEGFSAARPCAGLHFDESARTVVLVPGPRPSGDS